MKDDHNKIERSHGDELTPIESAALDALLSESIGGKKPPELRESILQQFHQAASADDVIKVVVSPVSRSQRKAKQRRRRHRRMAIVSGLAVAASVAALIWIRGDKETIGEFSVAQSPVAESSAGKQTPTKQPSAESTIAKSPAAEPQLDESPFSDSPITGSQFAESNLDVDSNSSVAAQLKKNRGEFKESIQQQTPEDVAVVMNAAVEDDRVSNIQTGNGNVQTGNVQTQRKQERRVRTRPARLTLVSRSIEKNFRNYWSSVGVRPTAKANASEVADRLSVALGVDVPATALANHNTIVDWLDDRKVRMSISRVWWTQVTGGNFLEIEQSVRKRLRISLAQHLKSGRGFNRYLVDLVSKMDDASSDFYTAMVPVDADPTHSDMITNLASLTMNVDVSCTRCHDSMIGGSHGQADYWGFAAAINRGLKKSDDQLHRVNDKPIANLFYETMDRREEIAQPEIPRRWLGEHSSVSDSQPGIDSISDWAVLLEDSTALAEGVVNSLWKLVHGRPLRGQAAHPMAAPMSDELVKIQQVLVDDLVSSDFDIRRTLAIILMSPTTHRSSPESLRDVWATDQSESRQTAIAFAGAVPAAVTIPMAEKVEQSMRAIGSISSVADRSLLGQFGDEDGKAGERDKGAKPLAWDFPDQADGPPVQWLHNVKNVEAKIAHLCYLAGQERVPESISRAAVAMEKAGVDESTLLHRVWWMAQGN